MTPTAKSLASKEVFLDPGAASLVTPGNVQHGHVRDVAAAVAGHFGLPPMDFASAPDDADLFDFSGTMRAQSSCAFLHALADGSSPQESGPAMVLLVGDALLEPFWPEGLGIVRGFHGALDAAATVRAWGGERDEGKARKVSAEAFSALKTLCGKTADMVLHRDIHAYDVDPSSRYIGI
jgi:hypothetical protein